MNDTNPISPHRDAAQRLDSNGNVPVMGEYFHTAAARLEAGADASIDAARYRAAALRLNDAMEAALAANAEVAVMYETVRHDDRHRDHPLGEVLPGIFPVDVPWLTPGHVARWREDRRIQELLGE